MDKIISDCIQEGKCCEKNKNMERSKVFSKAIELSDKLGYMELKNSHMYSLCDSVLINHSNRTFFFTQREIAKTIVENSCFVVEVVSQ